MKAIILCGGFGVRFPMNPERSKALLEVNGRPLVEHIVRKLEMLKDVEKLYVSTNRKFALGFERWLKALGSKDVEIVTEESLHDGEKMGAVGALDFVLKEKGVEGDFLVVNGDNVFEDDLVSFVDAFKDWRCPLVGLYRVGNPGEARGFGVVEIDEKNRIISFEEKPDVPASRLISTGIYAFPGGVASKLRAYLGSGQNPDAPGNFIQWLHKREEVRGFRLNGAWFDVGGADAYERARAFFEKRG
jgi:glucose-1-phosphate thymidylyltransferase